MPSAAGLDANFRQSYCPHPFRANAIDVEQVVLTRNDAPDKNGLASLQGHDFYRIRALRRGLERQVVKPKLAGRSRRPLGRWSCPRVAI